MAGDDAGTLWDAIQDFKKKVDSLVPGARIKLLIAWKEGDKGPFSMGYLTAPRSDERKQYLGFTKTKKAKRHG